MLMYFPNMGEVLLHIKETSKTQSKCEFKHQQLLFEYKGSYNSIKQSN